MLSYWLDQASWKRKESIFIVKVTSWILSSKTGLLEELKYYGDERTLMELFRTTVDEVNPFFSIYQDSLSGGEILISDIATSELGDAPLIKKEHSLIVRDIMWMEDVVRRKKSRHISFDELCDLCTSLSHLGTPDIWENFIFGLSIISDIYRSVPERPKRENIFPPGDFGETYFITQAELWNRGEKWLIFGTEKLKE